MLLLRLFSLLFVFSAAAALSAGCGDSSPRAPSLSGPRPDTLTVETIGKSVQGEAIQAVSLGTGQSVVLVIGGLHTGEENPSAMKRGLAKTVSIIVSYVAPVVLGLIFLVRLPATIRLLFG